MITLLQFDWNTIGLTDVLGWVGSIVFVGAAILALRKPLMRLGFGLRWRRILFIGEHNSEICAELIGDLEASGLFSRKRMEQVSLAGATSGKVGGASLIVIDGSTVADTEYLTIIDCKKEDAALIIHTRGRFDPKLFESLNLARNVAVNQVRGRFVSDVFTALMTTPTPRK